MLQGLAGEQYAHYVLTGSGQVLLPRLPDHSGADGDGARLTPGRRPGRRGRGGWGADSRSSTARRRSSLRFGLGGSRWLLVETPYVGWPLDLGERLFRLRVHGFGVVLAHPERNADVQERPELLEPLVAGGTLVQLTAASVDGRLGHAPHDVRERCSSAARAPHRERRSRAGHPRDRPVAAVAALRDDELARWLTDDVPRAILRDTETPTRPVTRPRRRWFR